MKIRGRLGNETNFRRSPFSEAEEYHAHVAFSIDAGICSVGLRSHFGYIGRRGWSSAESNLRGVFFWCTFSLRLGKQIVQPMTSP